MEVLCHQLLKVSVLTVVLFVFVVSASIITSQQKRICKSEECLAAAKILEDSMDKKIDPCDDFYRYACGNWPKNYAYKIDPSMFMDSFDVRYMQNEKEISEFLTQDNNPDEHESTHKARKLYSMCLDRKSYNGIEQLRDILSNIGLPIVPLSTKENPNFDYVSALAKATKLTGIDTFFNVGIDVNPYNRSLIAIWIDNPTSESEISHSWRPLIRERGIVKREVEQTNDTELMDEIIKKMCALSTFPSCVVNDSNLKADVLEQAENRVYIRDKARISSFIPTIYTLEELQSVSDYVANDVKPSVSMFNWTKYLEEMFNGLENMPFDLRNASSIPIVIEDISFIEDMIEFIYERNIKEMEFGIWWDVVTTLLPYADFDIFQAKYNITTPVEREKRCNKIVTSWFQTAIGYMYLNKQEYNKAKIEIETMLEYIRESYKEIFVQAPWMDQNTKEKVLMKFESMESLIAYPNSEQLAVILDELYGNVTITESFLGTMVTMIQNEIEDNMYYVNETGNATIENWMIVPLTEANAFYFSSENMMAIPAGLLGSPVYFNTSKALLYGSMGSIMGHEIAHGFDPSGRKYNSEGLIEDWWSNETSVKYDEKSRCFPKAYDNYNYTFQGIDQKVNSNVTWEEDVADNVGFKAALFAYRDYVSERGEEPTLHNFEDFTSEQLFSLGFANSFCENPTNDTTEEIPYMYHSPNGVRVNGVFKNSEELSNIWNCPKGTNMNPSGEKCSLW